MVTPTIGCIGPCGEVLRVEGADKLMQPTASFDLDYVSVAQS